MLDSGQLRTFLEHCEIAGPAVEQVLANAEQRLASGATTVLLIDRSREQPTAALTSPAKRAGLFEDGAAGPTPSAAGATSALAAA